MRRSFWVLSAIALIAASATCAGGSETEEPDKTNSTGVGPTTSGGGMGGSGGNTTPATTTTNVGGAGGMAGMGGAGGSGGSAAVCGNGMMEPGEGCDDGNMNNDDDCPDGPMGSCQPASCSDGFEHSGGTGTEEGVDCGGMCPDGCPGALLLSEIVVTPTAGEMIEIHNPGDRTIPLDDVYLADYSTYYEITQSMSPPDANDFRVQFPASTSIGPGEYITVSLHSATEFNTVYGQMPDYDFSTSDMGAPAMLGEMGSSAGLSNANEMLVMFRWDGSSDLVLDIDYLLWGDASDAMDKSNVMIGMSSYSGEVATSSQDFAPAPTGSLGHCVLTEGAEVVFGGNGPGGQDETSENMATTWALLSPTPGAPNNCNLVVAIESQSSTMYYLRRNDFQTVTTRAVTLPGQSVDGVTGIARHPTNGKIYAIIKLMSSRPLATLNVATGEATMVGTPAQPLAALAFADNGTLYGITGNNANTPEQLNTVSLTNGALTAAHTFTDADDGEALVFSPQTSLLYRFSGFGTPHMWSVNPIGTVVSQVTLTGGSPDEGLGGYWDPDANHMVVFDLNQDVLTITTAGAVNLTNLTVPSSMKGAVIP